MKFKNAVFVDQKFMETIAKCNEYEDWEPKGAYWFNRLVKKLRSAQEDYNDTRLKLVNKYADEPDKDGNVKVAEVHIPAFSTAVGELMEEEFEIEGIKPIKFPTGLKLSPSEMGLMEEVVDMSVFLDDEDMESDLKG